MRHRSAIIAGIVGVALAALIALFAFSPKGEDASTAGNSPLVGKLAPALDGSTVEDQPFDLDRHRGQWVLVNFFATWCPPCVAEHPELVALSQRDPDDLQVVSVAYEDTSENVQKFFAKQGGDWPVLVADTRSAGIDYGVIKLPESYLIAPDGTVVAKFSGGITADDVEAVMAEHDAGAASGTGASTGGGS